MGKIVSSVVGATLTVVVILLLLPLLRACS